MFKVGIITASDTCYKGQREDLSGDEIKKTLLVDKFIVEKYVVLPDDLHKISEELVNMVDNIGVDLVLTNGATGFSPRDITPEATKMICDKMVPGIPEAIRFHSMKYTNRAMLSRAVAGIRNKTLIVNLPGSPKAVRESLEFILESLFHGLEILTEKKGNCAR